jgi:hypothetical protein
MSERRRRRGGVESGEKLFSRVLLAAVNWRVEVLEELFGSDSLPRRRMMNIHNYTCDEHSVQMGKMLFENVFSLLQPLCGEWKNGLMRKPEWDESIVLGGLRIV